MFPLSKSEQWGFQLSRRLSIRVMLGIHRALILLAIIAGLCLLTSDVECCGIILHTEIGSISCVTCRNVFGTGD